MKSLFIRLVLAALGDERVRTAIVGLLREAQPVLELTRHRPISTNRAPGAI